MLLTAWLYGVSFLRSPYDARESTKNERTVARLVWGAVHSRFSGPRCNTSQKSQWNTYDGWQQAIQVQWDTQLFNSKLTMNKLFNAVFCAILLSSSALAAPAPAESVSTNVVFHPASSSSVVRSMRPSSTVSVSAEAASPTVPYASDDPNAVEWNPATEQSAPQAIRGSLGATILGPQNVPIDIQNPDLLAPPTTDAGTVGNAKWPMSLSKNRIQTGGWARQQNGLAGVDMRLEPGAIRELHWHDTAEWAYIISVSLPTRTIEITTEMQLSIMQGWTQITAINPDGQNFLATLGPGDLWYFPPGCPHSLQATNQSVNGTEFLLVFPSGTFNEDDTFLLTDWMAHTPKEVLARNFQTSISAFNQIPGQELYIFPSESPSPDAKAPEDPYGQIPMPFAYSFSQQPVIPASGGTYKIADSTVFNVSTQVAVAEITVVPGGMRELHWHPTQDEWGFFLEGEARVTLFAANGNAATFNYEPGDVSYVPADYGHYVENIGNTTLRFLEIFNTDRFQDVSLSQWLAVTPPELVQAHLHLDNNLINNLNKTKQVVVGPIAN
ncbi:hypothetical protein NM688_g7235 [Phlebia brevispora]|uniref:Uncharacterized protein n=1 Tax=Phlebia brevispora TaxID=194682 RepID=A0ACC1S7Q3_9APHY|nr:hypothetical protein NM688_g7235 [Phlebia brevispora]